MAADSKKLKNEDFRRLLATPSIHSGTDNKKSHDTAHTFTHRKPSVLPDNEKKKSKKQNYKNYNKAEGFADKYNKEKEDDIFDESEAKLTEILKNYRDRAAERRKGLTTEPDIGHKLIGDNKEYGSVLEATSSNETRKMQIQKSKYLGGDIEHTHLVKGLDYSLLNKVRNEMHDNQTVEKEHEKEMLASISVEEKQAGNKLAKKICKVLFESEPPKRQELFARGRMAYLVDLDDEESEVPSTLLRSVYDTQTDQSSENIGTDNLLISKLSQVLAYLRTDVKKKKKVPDPNEIGNAKQAEMNIYEDIDEYVPSKSKQQRSDESYGKEGKHLHRTTYFDSDEKEKKNRDREERERAKEHQRMERKRAQQEEHEKLEKEQQQKEEMLQKKRRKLEQEDAYAELYPGGLGMIDAGGESDEDDFSQMDQGNKKSMIKRWDFDSQEDFERYQSQREAAPRAAYQFGVKTSGGRKTRKNATAANEKKIDRELEKINKILEKGVSKEIRY